MLGFPIFASRRVRTTPFTERVEASGLSTYSVYNHMLIPAVFASLAEDCAHLKSKVQIWDVACERQVEIKGPDARKLTAMMSTRDLTQAVPGKGYYTPITDGDGGIINDPIALCIEEDRFWFSIADSDMLLWASGLAHALALDVTITEPDVSPLAIQGPFANQVMAQIFTDKVTHLKFFHYDYFHWRGHRLMIARSGWSKQGGFEIYLHDSALGLPLWDDIWQAGEAYDIRAGCPNLIERIESGLLSYGNEMTRADTPLECGLDKYCDLDGKHEFIGKKALLRQREAGVKKRLIGVRISGPPLSPLTHIAPCQDGDAACGYVTSAVFSSDFDSNIGMAMLSIEQAKPEQKINVYLEGAWREAVVTSLPFKKIS